MPTTLFTSQTPETPNQNEGVPGLITGTSFEVAEPGVVTHVQFFATSSVGGTYTGSVHEVTADDDPGPGAGTLLDSGVLAGSPTPGAYNLIELDAPVAVVPGVMYRAAMHNSDGRYVATPAFFSGALVSGPLTAPATGSAIFAGALRNGSYEYTGTPTQYPNNDFNGSCYFVGPVFVADSEQEDVEASAELTFPALQLSMTAELSQAASVALSLPAVQLSLTAEQLAAASAALTLPALDLDLTAAVAPRMSLALPLPALDLALTFTSDAEPDESRIPGSYRAIVTSLRSALVGSGLRVTDSPTDIVGRRDVVVGPPTFAWESLCDPDEPDSITFPLYLIEALHERAIERLLNYLPRLIRAVQSIADATIVEPASPGSFPAGASDLPCYQLTVEMTL